MEIVLDLAKLLEEAAIDTTSKEKVRLCLMFLLIYLSLVERQEQVYETCIAISIDKHRIVRHTGGNATHVL